MGGWWLVGGMRANTETSRSSARARAATTMSIQCFSPDFVTENKNVPGGKEETGWLWQMNH